MKGVSNLSLGYLPIQKTKIKELAGAANKKKRNNVSKKLTLVEEKLAQLGGGAASKPVPVKVSSPSGKKGKKTEKEASSPSNASPSQQERHAANSGFNNFSFEKEFGEPNYIGELDELSE